jgi:hypothetical protein
MAPPFLLQLYSKFSVFPIKQKTPCFPRNRGKQASFSTGCLLHLWVSGIESARFLESTAAQRIQGFSYLQDTLKDNKNQYLFAYFASQEPGIDWNKRDRKERDIQ